MSICPYVFDENGYYRYDPCHCGREVQGCFAGIYWPDVVPWILLGAILASIGFFLIFRLQIVEKIKYSKPRDEKG